MKKISPKEQKQGNSFFSLCLLINEHNEEYYTTYNIVELDRKEYDKFR